MNPILQIAASFLAQLGFGSALILPFFPFKIAGQSFVRFYYGLIVIFLGLFLLALYRMGQLNFNYMALSGLAVWIWFLSFSSNISKVQEYLMKIFATLSFLIILLYANRFVLNAEQPIPTSLLSYFGLIIGTVFLCAHLMNMIFGHWYLVNRDLPLNHLVRMSKLLIFCSYIRLISVGVATYLLYRQDAATFARLIDFTGHGVFFWARVLAGLGLPLLVSHLSWASAKIGSNQSATGILYAGVVFVLMGEIMALYLTSLTGIVF